MSELLVIFVFAVMFLGPCVVATTIASYGEEQG